MADADDDDDKLPVTDGEDNPVGSNVDAVQIVNTGKLLNALRPRVVFQRLKPADNASSHVGWQAIFGDNRDRERLTSRVGESAEDFGVRIYLYCWMGNHGHLLVETPRPNLSAFMASVLTGYTVYYNLRHETGGHVMQGRFGSTLVSGDAYLLRLSRYVHLNPVVVHGVRERPLAERREALRAYAWSSYRAYTGLAPAPAWLSREPLLAMTPGRGSPEVRYRRYVEAGLRRPDEAFSEELAQSPLALGPSAFRERVMREHCRRAGTRVRREDVSLRHVQAFEPVPAVLADVCGVLGIEPRDIRLRRRDGRDRGLVALALIRRCGLTERAVAAELGLRSGSAVSYLVRRLKARCRVEAGTAVLMRAVTGGHGTHTAQTPPPQGGVSCYFQG